MDVTRSTPGSVLSTTSNVPDHGAGDEPSAVVAGPTGPGPGPGGRGGTKAGESM